MKGVKGLITIVALIGLAILLIFASIDIKLYAAYIGFSIGLILLLGFAAIGVVSNARSNVKSIISILTLVGLIVVTYIIAPTSDVSVALFEKTQTGMGWSKIIGSGLFTTYALMLMMFVMILFFQVRKLFK